MRLIDADALKKDGGFVHEVDNEVYWTQKDIENAPTIDAEPVKHGRWERTADGAARCSACGRKMSPSQYGYAHCGLCGAKMDLEGKSD